MIRLHKITARLAAALRVGSNYPACKRKIVGRMCATDQQRARSTQIAGIEKFAQFSFAGENLVLALIASDNKSGTVRQTEMPTDCQQLNQPAAAESFMVAQILELASVGGLREFASAGR